MAGEPARASRYDARPDDHDPVRTADLPDTPTRDRNIKASAWVEAPAELRNLGDDLEGSPEADYKRRLGDWLLWRAGPAKGDAWYWAGRADDPATAVRFRLRPDGGEGTGADGRRHDRFRDWKKSLIT